MSSLTQAKGLPGDWKTAWSWSDESIIGSAARASSDMISWAAALMPAALRESPWLSALGVLAAIAVSLMLKRCLARRPVVRQQLVQSTLDSLPDAVALFQGSTLVDTVSYEGDTGAPFTEGSGLGLEAAAKAGGDSITSVGRPSTSVGKA